MNAPDVLELVQGPFTPIQQDKHVDVLEIRPGAPITIVW